MYECVGYNGQPCGNEREGADMIPLCHACYVKLAEREGQVVEGAFFTIRYKALVEQYPLFALKDWYAFVDEISHFMDEYLADYGKDSDTDE